MEELIQRITAATGLDPQVARQAVGMILGFIQKHAPEGAMGDLLKSIPGASEAVESGADAGGGGLMGKLGGMLGGIGGGAGGLMALAGQLQAKGLDMGQMKTVGQQIFQYGEEQIGPDKAREVFKNIPGLSAMM
ncbi:MAG: DUF2267 domain-containing protein [Hyphomicrobiales bacterium]|nr:DUF2267 domain-containing protein [Hyphomicrobiales bacterium]